MTQERTRDIVREWPQARISKPAMIAQLASGFKDGSIPNDSQCDNDTYARLYVEESMDDGWINSPPTGLPRIKR